MKPPYLQDQFKVLTERVSAKILSALKQANADITGINFQHGRKVDITKTIKQLDESPTFDDKASAYPMIWLYEPFTIGDSPVSGCWAQVKLKLAIFFPTEKDYTPEERLAEIYKPILDPIYDQLMIQIDKSGYYHIYDSRLIKNDYARKYMWGTNNNLNELINEVDAIEINNLTLDVYFDEECQS